MKTQTKVTDVEIQNGVPVKDGTFVLIPIDQKKDPMGSGAPNYFIVSVTETIEDGDKFLTPDGKIYNRKDFEPMGCDRKILVLPENFSPKTIEDIVFGTLKDGDKVWVECELKPYDKMGNKIQYAIEEGDYVENIIKLDENNYASFSKDYESIKKKLKSLFRSYFEGVGEYAEPIDPLSIITLGITDIQFDFKKPEVIDMIITLERPGLLIGKGGRTIDGVTEFLSRGDTPVKIKIIESKLWK